MQKGEMRVSTLSDLCVVDGWTDLPKDGQTYRRMDRLTDGWTDRADEASCRVRDLKVMDFMSVVWNRQKSLKLTSLANGFIRN